MSIQAKPLHSVGVRMKRKEDPRFIQGKGHYVDDLSFPGMLYLSLVRSTYPHAEITNIDISEAMKVPGVKAVITGKDLEAAGLGWLPTFHGFDKQMVLAIGKVLFQYQEVAAVFAETRAAAVDGAEAVQVDYAPLPVVADPFTSKTDKVLLRPDREQQDEPHLPLGSRRQGRHRARDGVEPEADQAAPLVPALSSRAARAVRLRRVLRHDGAAAVPRDVAGAARLSHGAVARHRHSRGQDPRDLAGSRRRLRQQGAGLSRIRVRDRRRAQDRTTGQVDRDAHGEPDEHRLRPRLPHGRGDWRDRRRQGHGAARRDDGRSRRVRCGCRSHQVPGRASSASSPAATAFPVAHAEVDAYFTNKAPGGIAYRCSFRVTEASYAIERGMDILADELGMDAVELRRKNFIRKDQFPYPSALGFTYDSGDYHKTLDVALEKIGYTALLKEQAEKRARGELMGIGFSTFTEVVGAGPSKHFDILGIKMFDSAEIRIHPTGAGIVRTGTKSQGQGHETTWAQIVAEELGLDPQTIMVEEGDTDTAPYGLGTYASRSTPVAGAAIVMAARRIREKARKIAAHLLEVGEGDVEWTDYKFQVKGVPAKTVTMKEVAFAAYTNMAQNEPGLEATYYYDPPNMTYPNGAYVAVVDVDRETGETKVRRFVAVDDCGVVINPMIVEGQIHGGLTEGFAMAFIQEIQYDAEGNNLNTNFTDYLVPTSLETPHWETGNTVTPSPHHPMGAKGVGESPNVGSPAAFVNAVIDALSPLGVRHIDMPLTRDKVWRAIRDAERTRRRK